MQHNSTTINTIYTHGANIHNIHHGHFFIETRSNAQTQVIRHNGHNVHNIHNETHNIYMIFVIHNMDTYEILVYNIHN